MRRIITRAKGGTKERRVLVAKIRIPDLWKIAHRYNLDAQDKEAIIETWALCHDMLRALLEHKP